MIIFNIASNELKLTLQKKLKFSIKDFFSKSDQIHSFLRIWAHLLKKSLMENFIFLCSVSSLVATDTGSENIIVFLVIKGPPDFMGRSPSR